MHAQKTATRRDNDGEVLAGTIQRISYRNEDTGFCVLQVDARGHRDQVTIIGTTAAITEGEWLTATGYWREHPTYGRQFNARFLRSSAPSSTHGIEKYLRSGMIRGIGRTYAHKLVEAFGDKVLDVIDAEPDKLREVPGIGPKRAGSITNAWAEQKAVREIMVFLHEHGAGTARAVRILKTYGNDAVEVISSNPYRLARDIRGIGFKLADEIAMKLGISKTAMTRVRAGIGYALDEATKKGHCGLPVDELRPLAAELLEVPEGLVLTALEHELAEGAVVADTVAGAPCAFLAELHGAEHEIADRLTSLATGAPLWPDFDVEQAIRRAGKQTGLSLAPQQYEAVRLALASKVAIVTGGPGVGKTTLIDTVLRILETTGVRLQLCAPTGRAARRMTEATAMEACTIHRLLETDPATGRFKRDAANPLDCDLLVVDETSMVDVRLMRSLLTAVPDTAALLIVGDTDQLPSVGPGQVLADLIASDTVPVIRLTEVFRQAARSRIVTNAHGINRGAIPDLRPPTGDTDFYFVRAEEPEKATERIVDLVKTRIPQRFGLDPLRDIQVLCPMSRGGAGARALNVALQAALNPPRERKVERFGQTFAPGDKVMQTVNDYRKDVYNGDTGNVTEVNTDDEQLTARFHGAEHVYAFGELDDLVLAYAATVHKSQGSEYPAVVVPVLTQHYTMLQRNLLYTAVTRGKRLVVLVGQKKAVAIAVRNVTERKRWSKLNEWLQDFADRYSARTGTAKRNATMQETRRGRP